MSFDPFSQISTKGLTNEQLDGKIRNITTKIIQAQTTTTSVNVKAQLHFILEQLRNEKTARQQEELQKHSEKLSGLIDIKK